MLEAGGKVTQDRKTARRFRWLILPAVASIVYSGAITANASNEASFDSTHRATATISHNTGTPSLVEWFENYGVDKYIQIRLIDAAESGAVWDSMSEDSLPVTTQTSKTDSEYERISTYEDGSILVETVELPVVTSPFSTMAMGTCRTYASGSGYRNAYDCKASGSTGNVTMGMYVSYTLVQGGPDTIFDAHSPYGAATLGTLFPNPPTLSIPRATESGGNRAYAKMTSTFKAWNNGGSTNLEFRVLVGNDSASTSWAAGL